MALFFFCLAAAHEQHRSSEIVPAQAPRWAVAVGSGGQHRDAPSVPTAAPASPPTSSRSPPGHVCSLFQYCSLTAPNYCCCLLLRRCWCRFVQHLTARGAAPPRSQPRAVLSTRRAANCVQAEMFRGRSVGFSAGIDLRRAALLSPPPRDLLHAHTRPHTLRTACASRLCGVGARISSTTVRRSLPSPTKPSCCCASKRPSSTACRNRTGSSSCPRFTPASCWLTGTLPCPACMPGVA